MSKHSAFTIYNVCQTIFSPPLIVEIFSLSVIKCISAFNKRNLFCSNEAFFSLSNWFIMEHTQTNIQLSHEWLNSTILAWSFSSDDAWHCT